MATIVINDITPRNQYTATSGQTIFFFTFQAFAATDLEVYQRTSGTTADDATQILTYVTNYTVTFNTPSSLPSTGYITLNDGATTGDIITVARAQSDSRDNYYINGGPFDATIVNADFDSDVLMIQQNTMYNQVLGLHYNVNDTINYPLVDNVLPVLPAGYIWQKADDDSGIIAVPVPSGGGGSGSVTSVGLSSSTLTLTGTNPITTSGTIEIELPTQSGLTAGSYTNTNLTVDAYGRITAAANGSGGSGSGSSLTDSISQTAHGFSVGNIVYWNGTSYALAQADSAADAEVIGIVSAVANVNAFTVTTAGLVSTLSGLTNNTVYFLSDVTAGLLTATPPTTVGHIEKPLLIAISTTSGYFYNYRGKIIPESSPVSGSWVTVSSATSMTSGVNYIVNGGVVAFTLPTTAAIGDTMQIACATNSWTLAQNAGQQIQLGALTTTLGTGGSLASTNIGDCIELLCITTDTNWVVLSSMGNITYV